jgi:hypothetical protein
MVNGKPKRSPQSSEIRRVGKPFKEVLQEQINGQQADIRGNKAGAKHTSR